MGLAANELTNQTMLEVSRLGGRVFRNAKGMFRQLYSESKQKAGLLALGSSDLIGFTAEGKFLALEIKAGRDTLKEDQEDFLAVVQRFGGIAGVIRSVEDVKDILENNSKKYYK